MSNSQRLAAGLRDAIIARPDTVLEDPDLMQALIDANERTKGGNIVDLRGIAMERLEARLDRLEDTHRNVIAAAYENLSGTNLIHRAILRMLDAVKFEDFLTDLGGDVAKILRVDAVVLVLETAAEEQAGALSGLGDILTVVPPGFVARYTGQRGNPAGTVTMRHIKSASPDLFGEMSPWLRSEACIRLDFGRGRMPGLLLLASDDRNQFDPQHGSELLEFFGGVFERTMRRWLG